MITCTTPPPSLSTTIHLLTCYRQPSCPRWGIGWVAELADFNFNIKYRPGKSNIDADVLSRLPLDPSEYMEACTAEMEKDAVFATIQAVIHQKEEATPWVAAVSASVAIVHAEPAVTDLVFRQLTSEEIQRAQQEDPDNSRILVYKKRGYPPSGGERKKRDSYNILLLKSME